MRSQQPWLRTDCWSRGMRQRQQHNAARGSAIRQCALAWLILSLGAVCSCHGWQAARRKTNAAQLQALDAELLTHDSATTTLEQWCAVHHLATEPRIRAERVSGADKAADAAVRQELGVGPAEPVRYRHVRLRCGNVVLSEADNWYVPARLTPAMNATLDATDEPFGRVVQPLGFRRIRRAAERLWPPPSAPSGASARVIPPTVLIHRAVLVLPDGTPFSYVVEAYQRDALGGR
jgi:chorismate-pyruvate lyase